MAIFQISKNKYAMGTVGKLAAYVVQTRGKKVVGIRGRRPMLEKGRFKKVVPSAAVRDALKLAVS